jgi:Bacterial PH domain
MRILDVEPVSAQEAPRITEHLVPGEAIHAAFRSPTAAVLFTAVRILLVERNALLDEKVETSSFSYRAMRQFSFAEASASGARAAVRIWLGADPQPLQLRAAAGTDLRPLQQFLAGKLG